MQHLLKSYLRRLTNLSGNNRSLILLRLIKDQFIDLHDFNHSSEGSSWQIIEQIIAGKSYIPLCPVLNPRDADENRLSVRLKKLVRRESFLFEERGSKDLYIGWPFITGKFNDGTAVRCPLIFFPVQVESDDSNWHVSLKKDVNITLNKSFLLAYAYYNGVRADEELIDRVIDDFDQDSTMFRTQLYELLKESIIEINFNQDNYIDELTPFRDLTKSAFEGQEKNGKLKLLPQAVMGIFPQSGSYLVPDYMTLQEKDVPQDLEEYFAGKIKTDPNDESQSRYSDRVLEENTFTPFELDAHQEAAIKTIKKGNSLCVQGPPGSGKSQLIANLVCDYLSRRKNVLVICQKRAALDVVYDRLKEKDLHDFVGLVHDFKSDRKSIFDQINGQIERVDEYEKRNNQLDSIHLERTFLQASRRIEQISEQLDEYKQALFDEEICGKSIKELYLISSPNRPSVYLKPHFSHFTYPEVSDYTRRLQRYLTYATHYEGKQRFWSVSKSFANYAASDRTLIQNAIHDAVETFKDFQSSSGDLLHRELDYDTAVFFLNKSAVLTKLAKHLDHEAAYQYFKIALKETPDESDDWLVEKERQLLRCFEGEGIETTLSSDELGRFQEALLHAIQARRSIFGLIRWKLFAKERTLISRVLVANNLKSKKEGFKSLLAKIDNRLNYEHNVSELNRKKWLADHPSTFSKLDIQNWFFYHRLARKTYDLYSELRNLDAYISFKNDHRKSQIELIQNFVSLLDQLPEHKLIWDKYLTETQLRTLLSKKVTSDQAIDELNRDFEGLSDFHKLTDSFSQQEREVAEEIKQQEGPVQDKIECFENSLALAWIDNIESKYPVLRSVSSLVFEQDLKDLREAVEEKRRTSAEITLLKTRERTYEQLQYNRLQNRVTYRDLQHQVTKKRQIWPLRKVISEFNEELYKLLPCWMVSPESASAVFPMIEAFDLVIFDEASQCFAERGIPGMFRGKQVVIAGDQHQLQPFDLYKARWQDDEEADPDLEVDSLLDLASRYLPSQMLAGHYRSQRPELIEFSNKHFYQGKLRMLPSLEKLVTSEKPIQFHPVQGVWENNQNEIEANQVAELAKSLLKVHESQSIGIVTFNSQQQGLIQDLCDEARLDSSRMWVKNIENVQGDERDQIIFSIGYAKDPKGKMNLRFGSLNLAGGENRLNVAITRAREAIHVVTSIDPSSLDTSQAANKGPKLLKEFLEFAMEVNSGSYSAEQYDSAKKQPSWYLKALLTTDKYQQSHQFGDLMIQNSHYPAGVVMTDDDRYYSDLSPKQTHVYEPEMLSDKQWPNIRVHSRQYWENPEEVNTKIKQFENRITQD